MSRLRAVFAAVAFVLLLPGSAQAEPSWLTPVDVGEASSARRDQSQLALDSQGNTIVAFTFTNSMGTPTTSDDVSTVQFSVRPAGGTYSPPTSVSAPGRDARDPHVAVDGGGNAIIVWAEEIDTDKYQVRMVTRSAASALGPVVELSALDAGDPQLVVTPGGAATFAWVRTDSGTGNRIVETRDRTAGGALGTVTPLRAYPTNRPFNIELAGNGAGASAAIWTVATPDALTAWQEAAYRPAGGNWDTNDPPLTATSNGSYAEYSDVVIDADGNATTVWEVSGLGRVYTAVHDSDDTAFQPNAGTRIDDSSGNFPELGIDAAGTVSAVWATDPGEGIIKVAGKPKGSSFGIPQSLSGVGNPAVDQQIAVAANGATLVLWQRTATGSSVLEAVAKPPGGAFGPVRGASAGDYAQLPSIGVDPSGNGAALWWGRTGASSPFSYRARVNAFDATGPEVRGLDIPAGGVAGVPVAMSANVFDAWSPVTVSWMFGDGQSAPGPAVSHAFGAPGTYNVQVTATDAVGNATSTTRTLQISPQDIDGDNFPVTTDCDDNNANVNPAAREVPGNRVDEDCNGKNAPFPKLRVGVQTKGGAGSATTVFTRLRVVDIPAAAKVQARCSGRGCPFKAKRLKRSKQGMADVLKALRRRSVQFRVGSTLEFRATAPLKIGDLVRYRFKAGVYPTGKHLCLPVGGGKPAKKCPGFR